MPKKDPYRLTLVEKAIENRKWQELYNKALLATVADDDLQSLLRKAVDVMLTVGKAAKIAKIDSGLPDVRRLHGACRTVFDCATSGKVTSLQRLTLNSGLEAVANIKPLIPERSFIQACVEVNIILDSRPVYWQDFLDFITFPNAKAPIQSPSRALEPAPPEPVHVQET